MVGAEDAGLVVEDRSGLLDGLGDAAGLPGHRREVVAGGEGLGVVGAEDAGLVVEQCPELVGGLVDPARLADPVGEAAADVEGLAVVGTEPAGLAAEHDLELADGRIDPARLAEPAGEVAAELEDLGVVRCVRSQLDGLAGETNGSSVAVAIGVQVCQVHRGVERVDGGGAALGNERDMLGPRRLAGARGEVLAARADFTLGVDAPGLGAPVALVDPVAQVELGQQLDDGQREIEDRVDGDEHAQQGEPLRLHDALREHDASQQMDAGHAVTLDGPGASARAVASGESLL